MGWYGWASGASTYKDFFHELIDKDYHHLELVDYSIKGSVAYCALRNREHGWTTGATFQMRKDRWEWMCKEECETVGPIHSECPKRIIRKLTPIDVMINAGFYSGDSAEWARTWRKNCLKSKTTKVNIKEGDFIKLDNPIEFSDGTKADTFMKEPKYLGRSLFKIIGKSRRGYYETMTRTRLRNLGRLKFKVVDIKLG